MNIKDFVSYITMPMFIGYINSIVANENKIIVTGNITSYLVANTKIRVQSIDGTYNNNYIVESFSYVSPNTEIIVKSGIVGNYTHSTGTDFLELYKEVDTINTNLNLEFSNMIVNTDNANTPIEINTVVDKAITKIVYDGSQVKLKTYGWLVEPYIESVQQEFERIMDNIGYENLSNYFKGMSELNTTIFTGLDSAGVDAHRNTFYYNMQNAKVVDAGSYVLILNDGDTALIKSVYYFIDNYISSEVNKVKFLEYGKSTVVTNKSGQDEIVTCTRPATYSFNIL